jgi:hypothetical protein
MAKGQLCLSELHGFSGPHSQNGFSIRTGIDDPPLVGFDIQYAPYVLSNVKFCIEIGAHSGNSGNGWNCSKWQNQYGVTSISFEELQSVQIRIAVSVRKYIESSRPM